MPWNYQLDQDFYTCERGNTWLQQEDGDCHVAWFKLDDNHWLEVAVEPSNYPSFKVGVIEETEAELAKHINEHCRDWFIHKCNVEGVKVDDNYVLAPDDRPESDPEREGSRVTAAMRMAAAETLGYQVDDERINSCLGRFDGEADRNLKTRLRRAEKQFQSQGGRGIELAEEIDNLRLALEVRKAHRRKPNHHDRNAPTYGERE